MLRNLRISILLLAAVLLGGSAAPLLAYDHDKCEQRIHRAEEKLRKAVDKHGEHSSQAERRRHELQDARRDCHYDDQNQRMDNDHRDDHHDEHHDDHHEGR